MGGPWAAGALFSNENPGVKIYPQSKLRHTKNICKNFLLSRFKKENEKMGVH